MTSPSRPRDAASLVIHRPGDRGPEVLMGRRHGSARFKPGVFVFPGGGIERGDERVATLRALDATIAPVIAVGGSQRRAQALAMAAIRETFEETGVAVGRPGDLGAVRHPSWQQFRDRGVCPDLGAVGYLGRAITPSVSKIRFHARFFMVAADHAHGEPHPATGELEALQWVPLVDFETLPMMQVTHLILDTLGKRLRGESAKSPFLSFQNGRRRLEWH